MISAAVRARLQSLLLGVALGVGTMACAPSRTFYGVDPESGTTLALVPGELTAPEEFAGSYRSAQLGHVEVLLDNATLQLKYKRWSCGCTYRGSARGTLIGNLAELELSETVSGCSRPAVFSGRGFVFCRRNPGRPLALYGAREYEVVVDHLENGVPLTEWRDAGTFQARKLESGAASSPGDPGGCP